MRQPSKFGIPLVMLIFLLVLLVTLPTSAQKQPFLGRIQATTGTGLAFPVNDPTKATRTGFSTIFGVDYPISNRFAAQLTVEYSRLPYQSRALYPGIDLRSTAEVLSIGLQGKYALTTGRFRPYLIAGISPGLVRSPSITSVPDPSLLLVGYANEWRLLLRAGIGADIRLSGKLLLFSEALYTTTAVKGPALIPVRVGIRTSPSAFMDKLFHD